MKAALYPSNAAGTPPAAQQKAALRRALRAAVSEEDVTAMAHKLRELALGGNLGAIRLLLSYVVGRPTDPPFGGVAIGLEQSSQRLQRLRRQRPR
jgi:hypothetical protein